MDSKRTMRGFTLVELLVVIAILGLLLSILIPAVIVARGAARRAQCTSRLRQIGVAVTQYEVAHQTMPPGRLLPDFVKHGRVMDSYTNYNDVSQSSRSTDWTGFRSVHVHILPFLEQGGVYELIDFKRPSAYRMTRNGEPYNANYAAYARAYDLYVCPADGSPGRVISENNYRYNFGGTTPFAGANSTRAQNDHQAQIGGLSCLGNGAFTAGRGLRRTNFQDGLSNTVLFSERIRGSGNNPRKALPQPGDIVTMPGRRRGLIPPELIFERCGEYVAKRSRYNFTAAGAWRSSSDYSNGWPFAGYTSTMYNHVAPPNWIGQDCGSWSATPDTPGEHAIVTARSYHPGGVAVVFADAHTRFVADSIDLDTWRALGSRAGRESGSVP